SVFSVSAAHIQASQTTCLRAVGIATLCQDGGKGLTPREQWPRHAGHEERSAELIDALCERLRVPVECRDLASLVAREHELMHRAIRSEERRVEQESKYWWSRRLCMT